MGSFTSPGIDTRQKGLSVTLSVLSEKTRAISGNVFCQGTRAHVTDRPRFDRTTIWLRVRLANHSTTKVIQQQPKRTTSRFTHTTQNMTKTWPWVNWVQLSTHLKLYTHLTLRTWHEPNHVRVTDTLIQHDCAHTVIPTRPHDQQRYGSRNHNTNYYYGYVNNDAPTSNQAIVTETTLIKPEHRCTITLTPQQG